MFQLDLQSLDAEEMRAILRQMNPTNVLAHAMLAVGIIQEAPAPAAEPANPAINTDPAQLPLLPPTADAPAPAPAKLTVEPGGQAPKRGRPKKAAPAEPVEAVMQPVSAPKAEPEVGMVEPETGTEPEPPLVLANAKLAPPAGGATPKTAAEAFVTVHGTAALLKKLQAFGVRRVGEVPAERADEFIALLQEGLPA